MAWVSGVNIISACNLLPRKRQSRYWAIWALGAVQQCMWQNSSARWPSLSYFPLTFTLPFQYLLFAILFSILFPFSCRTLPEPYTINPEIALPGGAQARQHGGGPEGTVRQDTAQGGGNAGASEAPTHRFGARQGCRALPGCPQPAAGSGKYRPVQSAGLILVRGSFFPDSPITCLQVDAAGCR